MLVIATFQNIQNASSDGRRTLFCGLISAKTQFGRAFISTTFVEYPSISELLQHRKCCCILSKMPLEVTQGIAHANCIPGVQFPDKAFSAVFMSSILNKNQNVILYRKKFVKINISTEPHSRKQQIPKLTIYSELSSEPKWFSSNIGKSCSFSKS